MSDTFDKLQTIFNELFLSSVTLTPDLTAKEVEEWDSLMHITLVVTVESTFNIRFKTGEVESTKNIGEFVQLIKSKLSGNER